MKEKEFLAILAALYQIENCIAVNTNVTRYGTDGDASYTSWEEAVELARERIQAVEKSIKG